MKVVRELTHEVREIEHLWEWRTRVELSARMVGDVDRFRIDGSLVARSGGETLCERAWSFHRPRGWARRRISR